MSAFHVVIPARLGSARLPGKPLLTIAGIPMVVHVARLASGCGAASVIVATDDDGISHAVRAAGYRAMMTRADHESGSDRVAEVARREGWPDSAIVINVQGDEPLLPPAAIRQLADAMTADAAADVATLCERTCDKQVAADPNRVKVVRDAGNHALYFSRSPIPAYRDNPGGTEASWLRHLGIYGYRVGALRRFVGLPPALLERAERLEQLRLLENGMRILVLDACRPVPDGVDTVEDIDRVRKLLASEPGR